MTVDKLRRELLVRSTQGDQRITWDALDEIAAQRAAALERAGLAPGSTVGLLGHLSLDFVASALALWKSGLRMVVLPVAGHPRATWLYEDRLRSIIEASDLSAVVASPNTASTRALQAVGLTEVHAAFAVAIDRTESQVLFRFPGSGAAASRRGAREGWSGFEEGPSDALVQFTSGSTAEPKGVRVSAAALTANIASMRESLAHDAAEDTWVSWLPMQHDMGLIGGLALNYAARSSLILMDPMLFSMSPRIWAETITTFGGTVSPAPDSAYGMLTRSMLADAAGIDLGTWRLAINGAEPIIPASFRAFGAAARDVGLRDEALLTVYGLAESTLAVTIPSNLASGFETEIVSRSSLEGALLGGSQVEDGADLEYAVVGSPVRGIDVRATDKKGAAVGLGQIGTIEVRGTSVFESYCTRTGNVVGPGDDGWFNTGDVGFQGSRGWVVCGRQKEVIIVGGRNVFPQDVEWVVESVAGVRKGGSMAVGVRGALGREEIHVLLEPTLNAPAEGELVSATRLAVRRSLGLDVVNVSVVDRGSLPKTSSGKKQRRLVAETFSESL